MLQRFREWLVLILIAALPLHALLVTVGTKMLVGLGHAPLTSLALWKEMVLMVILAGAFLEIVPSIWMSRRSRSSAPLKMGRVDWIDGLIAALLLLSVAVTALTHGDWKLYLFGFKYDFVPLVAFLILRRVLWSEEFRNRLLSVIIAVGGIVAAYGVLTVFLPQSFFVWLGYSDLHSLYLPDAPLAAYQQIGGTGLRRIQSTMSGPNQLGLWLLLPWSIAIVSCITRPTPVNRLSRLLHPEGWKNRMNYAYLLLIGIALLFTFSRSACIAATAIVVVALWRSMEHALLQRVFLRMVGVGILLGLIVVFIFPQVFWRLASTRDHLLRPAEAVRTMVQHPWGLGLGTAGPASNRVSDACVFLEQGSDPSWAADRPDLCVFVGGQQVQPTDLLCQCPFLPENWYLQIGVELGVLGFVLFVVLVVLVLRRLRTTNYELQTFVFLPFLGISIAAMFLHAWEDAAVAYSVWILASIALFPRDS